MTHGHEKKIRTVQIVNVRWFNATAWYGLELSRLLAEAGHETRVLGLVGTESFEKAQSMGLNPEPIPASAGNPLTWPFLAPSFLKLCASFKPHVVNAHRGEAFALLAALKGLGGYALVRTRGDQRLPKNTFANRYIHTHMADAVIATNSRMTTHFAQTMHVPTTKLHTILGGVDRTCFAFNPQGREKVRAAYGLTEQHVVFGLLGRFDLVKGQLETIRAVAHLVEQGLDNVRLLLVGFPTDTSLETVQGWIKQYKLERHVIITGIVDDVTACISAFDIGIIASLWSESIARAALEIMACNIPIISTDVGVMPDLVRPMGIAPAHDQTAFNALLHRAVTDTAFCQALQQEQKLRMHDLDSGSFLHKTLDVYAKAMQKKVGC